MKAKLGIFVLLFLVFSFLGANPALADETAYFTYTTSLNAQDAIRSVKTESLKTYTWSWTAAGTVATGTTKTITGFISQIVVDSGSSNFNIELQDTLGLDRLGGYGIVTTTPDLLSHEDFGFYPVFLNEKVFPVITNVTSGESGGVTVYLVP